MEQKNVLKLSDEAIGQIAKLIQLAILTGTDIVDNLRTLRLVGESEELYLFGEYKNNFNENLEKMLEEVVQQTEAEGDSESTDSTFTSSNIFE